MEIRQVKGSGSTKYHVFENIEYEEVNLESHIELFNSLKHNGYVLAEAFDSREWVLKDEEDGVPVLFTFDLDIYKNLIKAIKAFILLCRNSGTSLRTVRRQFLGLKRAIMNSNGLSDSEALEMYLHQISAASAYDIKRAIESFLSFYPLPNQKNIMLVLNKIPSPPQTKRELPPIEQIFEFDEIINEFSRTEPKDSLQKKYFYIVELWWYITNIIPIRPNEFLIIRKNCLSSKDDGSYWLEVPRSKSKSDSPQRKIWYQWIEINKNMYDLISEYRDYLVQCDLQNNNYLFPMELHERYQKIQRPGLNQSKYLSTTQLRNWISRFYDEIVQNKYGIKHHDRVLSGDTRHLAIINMFLQGFNMLSISRLAGQSRIESSEHYYSHMKEITQTYIYRFASLQTKEVSIENQLSDGFFGLKRKAYDRGKLYSDKLDFGEQRTVPHGICKDKEFPNNCVEDCRQCDYFIFITSPEDYQVGIQWLQSSSNDFRQKINIQINKMELLFSKTLKTNNIEDQNELKQAAKNLQELMNQKTTVDSLLLKNIQESEG